MLKKSLYISIFIALLILSLPLYSLRFYKIISKNSPTNKVSNKFVVINDKVINIEIADTPEKTSKGLSERTNLTTNSGMIFTFSKQDQYPAFWMKDMLIPIDIIWINDTKIIQIDNNVQPEPGITDTNLTLYRPVSAVDYVLEVNAGYCERNGIEVGDTVKINF